jgi:hypothetical protein
MAVGYQACGVEAAATMALLAVQTAPGGGKPWRPEQTQLVIALLMLVVNVFFTIR